MIFLTKLIKHRGLSSLNVKENTYEAIFLALNNPQYLGVEFDVRETKDHEFIIYHNPLINGKPLYSLKYLELPKYIPRLKDILKIKSSKMFVIELKNIQSFPKLLTLLTKYQDKNIYVMSFSNTIINKCMKENKTYKLGILNYVFNTSDNLKDLDFVCVLNNLLNDNLIKSLKNKEIFSYGIINDDNNYKYENVYYITDN